MSVAFDEPSLAVDTHVERVFERLGINRWKDNVRQVEDRLCSVIPRDRCRGAIINSFSLEDTTV